MHRDYRDMNGRRATSHHPTVTAFIHHTSLLLLCMTCLGGGFAQTLRPGTGLGGGIRDMNANSSPRAEAEAQRQKLMQEARQRAIEQARQRALDARQAQEQARQQQMQQPGQPPPNPAQNLNTNQQLQGLHAGQTLTKQPAGTEGAWVATASPFSLFDDDKQGFRKVSIYLTPASVAVEEGQTFVTEAKVIQLDKTRITRIELVIKYQPDHVEPVSIHHGALERRANGTPEWGIDRQRGEFRLSADLESAIEGIDTKLLDIVWRALRPARGMKIDLASGDAYSAAFSGERNVTLNQYGPEGGLSGTSLRIFPRRGSVPEGDHLVDSPVEDFATSIAELGILNERPPSLSLQYDRKDSWSADEWITVDVHLDNSGQAAFDEVRLALEYDPEVIEIADADKGNAIHSGVNLLDGPFRDTWNWDVHLENRVRPELGLIGYRMASQSIQRRPSGVLVRIVGRILRPTARLPIRWVRDSSGAADKPTTAVYFVGEDLYRRQTEAVLAEGTNPFERPAAGPRVELLDERADPDLYRF